MNKNDFTIPFVIIGLSAAFFTVSFLVYLSRGKSKYWVAKKMLIGSLLISTTSITQPSCNLLGTDCYDPAMPNDISLDADTLYNNSIVIDLKKNNTITGNIYNRAGEDFSFNITDTIVADTIQQGRINPVDGDFNHSAEEIILEINDTIPSNTYYLNLYQDKTDNQIHALNQYKLIIHNEN